MTQFVPNGCQIAAFLLASALAPGLAMAQYKCVTPGGSTSFQQTPCDKQSQGKRIEIKAPAAADAGSAPAPRATSETMDQRMARGMGRERRVRELEAELGDLDNAIGRRNNALASELNALQQKKSLAKNNLAGATWEQSISTEMQAVTAKYKGWNDVDFERQKTLRAELAEAKKLAAER